MSAEKSQHWRTTEEDRIRIARRIGAGLTNREISRDPMIPFSHVTIGKWRKRFDVLEATSAAEEEDNEPMALPIEPEPFKFRDVEEAMLFDDYVLLYTMPDRKLSCEKLARLIRDQLKIRCNRNQVMDARHRLGLVYSAAKKRNKLTPERQSRRLEWAKSIQKSALFGKEWVFSDESMFAANPITKKIWMFQGETSDEVYQDFAGYPVKVMAFAAIGHGYKSPLIRIPQGSLNKEGYIRLLEENGIFEALEAKYGKGNFVWMQDGARPHTAKETMDYLRAKDVILLENNKNPEEPNLGWPPYSPDLNPIEAFWGVTKGKIVDTVHQCKDDDSLFLECSKAWDGIPQDCIDSAIDCFPARVMACESLAGHSLNGHSDVVRAYKKRGSEAKGLIEAELERRSNAKKDFENVQVAYRDYMEEYMRTGRVNYEKSRGLHESHVTTRTRYMESFSSKIVGQDTGARRREDS
jgi:transposase